MLCTQRSDCGVEKKTLLEDSHQTWVDTNENKNAKGLKGYRGIYCASGRSFLLLWFELITPVGFATRFLFLFQRVFAVTG